MKSTKQRTKPAKTLTGIKVKLMPITDYVQRTTHFAVGDSYLFQVDDDRAIVRSSHEKGTRVEQVVGRMPDGYELVSVYQPAELPEFMCGDFIADAATCDRIHKLMDQINTAVDAITELMRFITTTTPDDGKEGA